MTGKDLRIQRAILGLNQVELAAALELNSNTISRYEKKDDETIPKTVELAVWALVRQQEDSEKKD